MAGEKIIVALDWTPNTNHAGFVVALASGLYRDAGVDVELRSPDHPDCQGLTPARQVAAGLADFAVTPSETCVSFATTDPGKPRLVAVAALLQGSTSAIATLKSSGLDTMAKLEGKRYASYGGRFEDAIVARMVTNAGGDGSKVQFHDLEQHGYAEGEGMGAGSIVASHLERGLSDSTWIFSHWEGILASRAGQQLNEFSLEDAGVPYGYAPVLICDPARQPTKTAAFLAATAQGYARAAAAPGEAAAALCSLGHPSLTDAAFVAASAEAIKGKYLSKDGAWGWMDVQRWTTFVDFLSSAKILVDREGVAIPRSGVDERALFTNDFLPQ